MGHKLNQKINTKQNYNLKFVRVNYLHSDISGLYQYCFSIINLKFNSLLSNVFRV